MAKTVGSILTGPAIASVRGGSNPLGGSRVILGTISKEGLVSTPVQPFTNQRGENFSKFLRSVKGSDGGAAPLFSFQELSARQTESINYSKGTLVNAEQTNPQVPVVAKNKPSVIWFGPSLPNLVPERGADIEQPKVVEKSVSFPQTKSESAHKSVINNESKSKVHLKGSPQVLVEVGLKTEPVTREIPQPRRQLSVVDQVNLLMMVRQARMALRPKTQAIPMVGVEEQAGSLAAPLSEPAQRVQIQEDRASESQVKIMPKTSARRVERKTRTVSRERRNLNGDKFRTRFVERDIDMNTFRLKALVKSYQELQGNNPDGEIEGEAVSKKANILSRQFRSSLLDKRGYLDREDGNQKRMELFLNSVRVNKRILEQAVEEFTALNETDKRPRRLANKEDVVRVFTQPRELSYAPVEAEVEITERVEGKVERSEVLNSRVFAPQVADEKPVLEAEFNETKSAQEAGAGILSRPFDLGVHNMLFEGRTLDYLYPRLQREDLVLN